MGSLILILPVLAFDTWLFVTIGRKQFQIWSQAKAWPQLTAAVFIGLALGVWLTFFVGYKWDDQTRFRGFPIPDAFSFYKDGNWSVFDYTNATLHYSGMVVNFFTGLVAPLIPYKIADFLKTVKAELK